MSTNSVVSAAELEIIKQQLKKTAGLGEITKVEPRLPQSKSFLKVLGILYQDSKTYLSVTPAQMAEALSSSAAETTELVDMDTPSHVLCTDSTLSLEQVLTKPLLQDSTVDAVLATTISAAARASGIKT